jgi:hypothetical protein
LCSNGGETDRRAVPAGEKDQLSPGKKDACPESFALGKAINYMLKCSETLSSFIDDGSPP